MKILVAVKRVIDYNVQVRVKERWNWACYRQC
jgi:Electron transfer flavoprotein, beta subunit